MTHRDQSHLDNPERCASEGEAPSDYQRPERDPDADRDRLIEDGYFGEVQHGNQFQEQGCFYSGDLKLDCVSAIKQSALMAHSDFCVANGMDGSVYRNMAKAFKPAEHDNIVDEDAP